MTQGERIKEIRKSLGLTLEKFGDRLGVGKTAVSKIEHEQCTLTEQMKKSVCREFNVNYDWLEYGDGEMFLNLPESILGDLCSVYGCDDDDRKLIETYLECDSDVRAAIKLYIKKFAEKK